MKELQIEITDEQWEIVKARCSAERGIHTNDVIQYAIQYLERNESRVDANQTIRRLSALIEGFEGRVRALEKVSHRSETI